MSFIGYFWYVECSTCRWTRTNTRIVSRPSEDRAVVIPNPSSLVPRVLNLLQSGRNDSLTHQNITHTKSLVCSSFAVLIEGSLRDPEVWNAVKNHVQFDMLITSLLLDEREKLIRRDILERLKIISGPLKPLHVATKLAHAEEPAIAENPLRIDMLATIWNSIVRIIPKAREHATQSEEFFTGALWIFRSVAQRSCCEMMFNEYMKQWTDVLLEHDTEEVSTSMRNMKKYRCS